MKKIYERPVIKRLGRLELNTAATVTSGVGPTGSVTRPTIPDDAGIIFIH